MFHTDTIHEVRATGHNCTRGDETRVDEFEPESKRQVMEWRHTTSTRKKKLKCVSSAGKTTVTCVAVMNFLPGRLADSPQEQHCTTDEAVQRGSLTEWEMHGFVRVRKTVLKNDGLRVWCCEAQWLFRASNLQILISATTHVESWLSRQLSRFFSKYVF